jgi:four helix bundle protein
MDTGTNEVFNRTKQFALRIIKMYAALPKTQVAKVIGNQILRSGTSVGAQYAEAHHAKSNADFLSKVSGSLQELEETRYWLELLELSAVVKPERIKDLQKETSELIAIFITISKKVR